MCLWHAHILSRMQNLSWSLFVFFPAIWSLVLIGSSSECGFQAAQLDDVFVKAHNWTLHNTLTISDGNANKKKEMLFIQIGTIRKQTTSTNASRPSTSSLLSLLSSIVIVCVFVCDWFAPIIISNEDEMSSFASSHVPHYYIHSRSFCMSLSIAKLSNVHSVEPFNRQETVVSLRPGTGRLKYLYWLLMILDDALEMCARASYTLYATPATDKQIK